jgi:hypothetical protein
MGQAYQSYSGIHFRPFGVWGWSTAGIVKSPRLEPHVRRLLKWLEPKEKQIISIVKEMEDVANVNLWWNAEASTAGYSLPSALLGRLCRQCDRPDFVFSYDEEKHQREMEKS